MTQRQTVLTIFVVFLFLIFLVAMGLMGITAPSRFARNAPPPPPPPVVYATATEEYTIVDPTGKLVLGINEVEYKGHIYLTTRYGQSLLHFPDCPCQATTE